MAVKRTGQPSFIEALLPQGSGATWEGGQLSRLDAVRKIPMTRKTPAINLLPTTKYPPCHFSRSKCNNATGPQGERGRTEDARPNPSHRDPGGAARARLQLT